MSIRTVIRKILSALGITANKESAQVWTRELAIQHNTQERLNAFYANPENVADYINPTRKKLYKEILAFLRKRGIQCNGKSIADVGCGTGHLLRRLNDVYHPVSSTGYDYSEEALKIARDLVSEAEFEYIDIVAEKPEKEFDLVLCVEVLEHLAEPEKALRNLLGMIAPLGSLFITVPNTDFENWFGHIHFWNQEQWTSFLKNTCNGFQVEVGLLSKITNYAIIQPVEVAHA